MNFPVMKVQEIKWRFDISFPRFEPGKGMVPALGECHFWQEVAGVTEAVKWVYRTGYTPTFGWLNEYWACYSMGVELMHIVYGSQIRDADLQFVDAAWKKLSDDPFAAMEESLEEGNNVTNSSNWNERDKEGVSQERGEARFSITIPDFGFPGA